MQNKIKEYIIYESNYIIFLICLIIWTICIYFLKISTNSIIINNYAGLKNNHKELINKELNNVMAIEQFRLIKINNIIKYENLNPRKLKFIKNNQYKNFLVKSPIPHKSYSSISLNSLIWFLTPKKQLRVSSNFSLNRLNPITGHFSPHKGVDIALPIGTPIFAISKGEVIVAKKGNIAGNYVTILHNNGYITRYMHMKKILVKIGQKIQHGDTIGLSGNTGRSTGPHLHFELWIHNKAIDPLKVHIPIKSIKIK
ncbi:hypothetical protein FD726_00685 [Pantoea sp. SoEX]|nr:hypothetical protein [Pantoea sp. SoEX]